MNSDIRIIFLCQSNFLSYIIFVNICDKYTRIDWHRYNESPKNKHSPKLFTSDYPELWHDAWWSFCKRQASLNTSLLCLIWATLMMSECTESCGLNVASDLLLCFRAPLINWSRRLTWRWSSALIPGESSLWMRWPSVQVCLSVCLSHTPFVFFNSVLDVSFETGIHCMSHTV